MPESAEFGAVAEPFRRELLAHCYRMVGSVDDAEDLVQETYLRAWRSYGGFEGRASLRTWLYRIATNACLTALRHGARRQLPSGLGAPGEDGGLAADAAVWLQPVPDALVGAGSADPEATAVARESLRLALVAGLQYLPARQRAVLLLRDVLAFPAAEAAEILGTTTTAVKSALQRARARLEEAAPAPESVAEPDDPRVRDLLDRYVEAFVRSDPVALRQLLAEDVALELPPSPRWYAGSDAASQAAAGLGAPGDWRMVPTAANGLPAAAAYLRAPDGTHRAFGVAVLTPSPTSHRITRITVFATPSLIARFGLPEVYEERAAAGGGGR